MRRTFSCLGYGLSNRRLRLVAILKDEHFSQKANAAGAIDRVNPSRNAQAVYAQLLLAWQEQLFVTSGFRLDDSSVYGTHVNPRVSVAYIMPGLGTKLRSSLWRRTEGADLY